MNRIAIIRKQLKLSQDDLAEVLEMGQPAVSKLEREATPLTLDHLRKIAKFFGCRVGDLEDPPLFDAEVLEAATMLSKMPDDIQRHAIRVVRNLSSLEPKDAARLADAASALLGPASDQTPPQEDEPGMPRVVRYQK